jgi:uncharacterized protein (TIGR02246 family)
MKKALSLILMCATCVAQASSSDKGGNVMPATEQQAISRTLTQFESAWHARDMQSFGEIFTDDAQWVNIVGMRWVGKQQVVRAHERLLATRYKGVDVHNTGFDAQLIAPGVALVTWFSYVDAFTMPDGTKMPQMKTIGTLVMVQRGERWLIRAGENVPIDERAAAHDPGK